MAKLPIGLAILLVLSGCKSAYSEPAKPALLTNSSPEAINTLQKAIEQVKGGKPVMLADTVFTKRSELLIDHGTSKDLNGMPVMGAHNIESEKFILQIRNNQCELYYPKKDLSIALKSISCKAL